MPAEQADGEPQGRLEAGAGGGNTPEPVPITVNVKRTPPRSFNSIDADDITRVSSTLSQRSAAAQAMEKEIREADNMAREELVRELATPRARFAPLKTAREKKAVAAPFGPDEPMSLQGVLRGASASIFNIAAVPTVGQSVTKVRLAFLRARGSTGRPGRRHRGFGFINQQSTNQSRPTRPHIRSHLNADGGPSSGPDPRTLPPLSPHAPELHWRRKYYLSLSLGLGWDGRRRGWKAP